MVAYTYRMPAGIPGAVTRAEQSTVEPAPLSTADYPTAYGQPVVIDATSEEVRHVKAGDEPENIYGMYARPFPTHSSQDALGTATPPTSGVANVEVRGYMTVVLQDGDAVKDGKVYVRIDDETSELLLGGIEAAFAGALTATAGGSNTGDGTVGTTSVTEDAITGDYTVTFTAATAFTVSDPNGTMLVSGATGTAYSAGGIGFTITAGSTAFVAGDTFTLAVSKSVIPVPGCYFMGAADGSGYTEIAYNI